MNVYDDPSRHGMICFKAACDGCNKPRAADVTLKQCKGCKVTWYCSKDCQIASWKSHKYVCTSRSRNKVPPIYAPLGRATMAELIQAAKDWTEAHRLGLFMVATVLVELGGGVDLALSTPHVVVFELGPPEKYDGSPATAFTLDAASYSHRDELQAKGCSIAAAQWGAPTAALREATARMCREDPDVAGLVPVTFCLRGSSIAPNTSFPLCRPRILEGEGGVVDESTKKALEGVLGWVSPVINEGIVMRAPVDADQIVPDIGKLVRGPGRKGSGWVWTPPLDIGADALTEFLRWCEAKYPDSGPRPSDSFTAYHRLWPYRLAQDGV